VKAVKKAFQTEGFSGILGCTMSTPSIAEPGSAQPQPKLVSLAKQYQPLLSICACIISFAAGYAWKVYSEIRHERDSLHQEWLQVLGTIDPDGPSQLRDALRLLSFEQYPDYREEARETEIGILTRMADPEFFDRAYFPMQNTSHGDEINELEDVDRALSREIRSFTSFADFSVDELKLSSDQRLQRFLLNPSEYLSDERLANRAEVVIYELDSVSGGLNCVLKSHSLGCPPLRPSGRESAEMILVNHEHDFEGVFKDPRSQPSYFKTCTVQTVHAADKAHDVTIACE
jgi:hypothetical protein